MKNVHYIAGVRVTIGKEYACEGYHHDRFLAADIHMKGPGLDGFVTMPISVTRNHRKLQKVVNFYASCSFRIKKP